MSGSSRPKRNVSGVAPHDPSRLYSRVLWLLLACGDSAEGIAPNDDDDDDDVIGDDDDDDDDGEPLDVPAHVALPYASNAAPGSAELVLTGTHDQPLDPVVTGPFTVEGDLDPVDGTRTLTVSWTGTSEPQRATGAVDIAGHTVTLAAVIGRDLPTATWTSDAWGLRATIPLPSAPYPTGDASVLVFLPTGAAGPLGVVTHFHGHNAVLADIASQHFLVEQHALSGRNAVLVVPQGPVNQASGDFGQLMDPGAHEQLVDDVIAVLYRDALDDHAASGDLVVTAHSGGYRAVARTVEHGGLPISSVHLFDALYAEESTFHDYIAGGGRLLSAYTSSGGTVDDNGQLTDLLDGDGLPWVDDFADHVLASHDVVIGWSEEDHHGVMWAQRNFARWLVPALPPHPAAPPTLLLATPTDTVWADDPRDITVTETNGVVSISAGGDPSDVYAATGTDWLVVDGFDRVLDGSWGEPTHDFAARVGIALGSASTAANEAVISGLVDLSDYDHVLWLLGDEGLRDKTFTEAERDAIDAFLADGGTLVLSGAELGFATSGSWLSGLGIDYVSDDAGSTTAGGRTFGVHYDEDFPDVLDGDTVIWTYGTGGGAAVRTGPVTAVGFGLENLSDADLPGALDELR